MFFHYICPSVPLLTTHVLSVLSIPLLSCIGICGTCGQLLRGEPDNSVASHRSSFLISEPDRNGQFWTVLSTGYPRMYTCISHTLLLYCKRGVLCVWTSSCWRSGSRRLWVAIHGGAVLPLNLRSPFTTSFWLSPLFFSLSFLFPTSRLPFSPLVLDVLYIELTPSCLLLVIASHPFREHTSVSV